MSWRYEHSRIDVPQPSRGQCIRGSLQNPLPGLSDKNIKNISGYSIANHSCTLQRVFEKIYRVFANTDFRVGIL